MAIHAANSGFYAKGYRRESEETGKIEGNEQESE